MASRRDFLKATGTASAMGISGLAGCIGSFGSKPYVDGTVTFLMSPTEPQDQMRAQYKPIQERFKSHLSDADGVEMRYAPNYAATLEGLNSGTADVAETGPFAAALGARSEKANIILQRKGYGSWQYESILAVRKDSDISSVKDLEGKKVAFADPLSASGSLYPLSMIKKGGLKIPETPGSPEGAKFDPQWATHAKAASALTDGQVAAAGMGAFVYDDEKMTKLKNVTGIPRAPILVSPELSEDKQEKIKTAFTKAENDLYYGDDGKKDTEDDLWFNGVRPADKSTYQPVIDIAKELGYGPDIFGDSDESEE